MPNPHILKKHAELVDRMSTTLGLDLEEAMMKGQMQLDTLGDAVLRCTGCDRTDACGHWLEEQQAPAEQPPGYCRNTHLFDLLKDGKHV